ncbi:hypothetical protein [Rhodopila globiformis]|uniref:Intracellular septation protein A n=1 Tax=Rhodopila globiformis TaxID=1071 RepID=A0A2S6NG67_RHOGL|nr:hypothetical protein [Rhodopila globiformis]PPQ33645.1 hypothetical protein CCS01_13995 [Rhodopila globiformis]
MGLLLAFAPFILFTVLDALAGPLPGLAAGTLVAAALLLRDAVTAGRTPKILDIGSALLFGGLALYTVLAGADWPDAAVPLCVDAGLLVVVLASLALGRPFTLQYAQEQVSESLRHHPILIRANVVVTRAWAVAFAVMALAEVALPALPTLPPLAGIGVTVLALAAAVAFTLWYPQRVTARRRIQGRPPGPDAGGW